jgi:RNA polymerase sigma-70 factor (ECF subfamily)
MTITPLSDATLVARCRGGDQDAWGELVERFSRYVYAIAVQAYRLREEDAEDVFQEVFARAYERLDELRDDEAIRPWLAQVTRRLAIDRLRAGEREQPTEEELHPSGVEETMVRLDEAVAVHEAMATLPERCQEILDRFFARDESYKTISGVLGIPPGTIASRISRCLGKLRESLGEDVELHLRLEYRMEIRYEEERIASLIAAMPPAPTGWVEAAAELPLLRRSVDDLLARAEADQRFRAALLDDLEAALESAGYEPERRLSDAVRARLSDRPSE